MTGCSPIVPPAEVQPVSRAVPASAPDAVSAGQRRRRGIEPAYDAARRTSVLKTGEPTRCPDASEPDLTGAVIARLEAVVISPLRRRGNRSRPRICRE